MGEQTTLDGLFYTEDGELICEAVSPEASGEFIIKEEFRVDDDAKAEWALRKILARRKERDRMLALIKAETMRLEEKRKAVEKSCDNDTNWLEYQLRAYMETVECRHLKASDKYKLLSGTLVRKHATVDFKRDDEAIIKWLEGRGMYGMIQIVKKPCWAELKKLCEVSGDSVVLAGTGEIIEGITAEESEGQFVIEEAKE